MEPSGAGLDGGDGTEQAAGVLVAGVGEDLLGGALLDDLASVHDGDGVRHLGHEGEVVGDEDHRKAELLAQLVEQVDDLLLHGHVEGGGGSSATTSFGSRVRAMAMSTRWRWPPDSSCG